MHYNTCMSLFGGPHVPGLPLSVQPLNQFPQPTEPASTQSIGELHVYTIHVLIKKIIMRAE